MTRHREGGRKNMAEKMRMLQLSEDQQRPVICEKCGGVLVYKGLGEYEKAIKHHTY